MSQQTVIAGAGHAAGQIVATLRQHKHEANIVLLGDEPWLPYQRPPLSKKFLAGELPAERLAFKPESFYDGVDVRLSTRVTNVDRAGGAVLLDDGNSLDFDTLFLATGSRVRKLDIPGAGLAGIHYLRSIADVEAIRHELAADKRLVIIGAGYIGLEVAAVARQLGLDVTVIEMAERVMSRVVCPAVSSFYAQRHVQQGVNLRMSTGIRAFEGDGRVDTVVLDSDESCPADLVVVGVGILPNTELAADAGLETDDGIVVDDHCRTSDARIYAVGDCTRHPNTIYDRQIRLESVHNALEQAKTAAANACGKDIAYAQVPWFWSDQYDIKLQIAGLSEGHDDVVVRGNPGDGAFSCAYLRAGRLIALDAINTPKDFMQAKALIAAQVEPDAARLADPATLLRDLA